jgi:hypothetical protein
LGAQTGEQLWIIRNEVVANHGVPCRRNLPRPNAHEQPVPPHIQLLRQTKQGSLAIDLRLRFELFHE